MIFEYLVLKEVISKLPYPIERIRIFITEGSLPVYVCTDGLFSNYRILKGYKDNLGKYCRAKLPITYDKREQLIFSTFEISCNLKKVHMFKYFHILFLTIILILSVSTTSFSQKDSKKGNNATNNIDNTEMIEIRPENAPRSDKWKNKKDALGRKQGLWKYYTDDGIILLEITFQNDVKHGALVRHHSSNGVITEESNYFNGRRDGEYKRYTYNGLLTTEGFYSTGRKNGLWMTYFAVNGEKKTEGSYANGRKIGLWRYYNSKGKLKSEGEYKEGLMEGEWKYYDNDGTPLEQKKYMNGSLAEDKNATGPNAGKNKKTNVKVKTTKNTENKQNSGSTPPVKKQD